MSNYTALQGFCTLEYIIPPTQKKTKSFALFKSKINLKKLLKLCNV